MKYSIDKSVEILKRTPLVLEAMLDGLSDEWLFTNEGENTWSAYDVVGHLIHGEQTDWIIRMKIILNNPTETFPPFDRFAQFKESKGKSIKDLLSEFKSLRTENIQTLLQLELDESGLDKTGIHPHFGKVSLRELLATWTAHDLNHLGQIVRILAKQYKEETGPWVEYLRILQS